MDNDVKQAWTYRGGIPMWRLDKEISRCCFPPAAQGIKALAQAHSISFQGIQTFFYIL